MLTHTSLFPLSKKIFKIGTYKKPLHCKKRISVPVTSPDKWGVPAALQFLIGLRKAKGDNPEKKTPGMSLSKCPGISA